MSVKSFKMVGGDEVVARVLDTKSSKLLTDAPSPIETYVVSRPHILQIQPMGNGQVGLAFVPWTLSNPTIERMEIPASAIVLVFDPSANVEKQYLEQTSGISIATPGQRIST